MDSFEQVLAVVKEKIAIDISEVSFNCWIKAIEPVKLDHSTAIIYIKSPFHRDIIIKQYYNKLKEAFNDTLGFPVDIVIATEDDINQYLDKKPDISINNIDDSTGNYEYTFDTFIVGSSNNFAYAASKAVANAQTHAYNPLFIYGPSGLGKTHLLYAITHQIKQNFPEKKVICVNSESFTNEFINCIEINHYENFRQKYRSADVLLIDDIQFISKKERTQEEFFHTFNELHSDGRQIVLTSDRLPKDIKTLEDRLRTRFEGGIITDIGLPDIETRIAIIKRKAELIEFNIPIEVAEYIASKLKNNIRQLEGAVKKLKAFKMLTNASMSIGLAQTVIKEVLTDNEPIPITIERIIDEVATTFNVLPADIRSTKRASQISQARQAAIYIVRDITGLSQAAIGDEFGGRDHSTIIYTLKQVEKQIKTDKYLNSVISDIIKNIRNS